MYFANEKGERVSPSTYGFPDGSPSLQITTFLFKAEGPRTRLTVRQGPIPTGMGENAKAGWTTSLEKAARAVAGLGAASADERAVVATRIFDAPRERVFEVLTKPEHIQKWWGPSGVGIATVEIDARPDGELFVAERWRDGDGSMNYFSGIVREITPPSRVVYAFHFVDEKRRRVSLERAAVPADWRGEIVQEATLEAEGSRTRVTIRLTGFPSDRWGEMANQGLAESFGRLENAVVDDMRVTPAGDREIVITRPFNAPRALVYEAFTKAEHVQKWWGPSQYGPVTATADFRAGGRYRFAQGSPQGEIAFSGEVRESSPERIVFVEEFEQMPGHGALTTVTLEERGGKTLMTLRSVYQSKDDRDAVIASGMEWGARLSYLQLDEVIDSLGKAA
ncbi:MAG TPA: SRPBCC domain-containing protein, partial [Candidatus Acidoferrales bacterium]|nr:SRPBCC domain-containing protein [Candidatus Acidoferrales bacterium]